MPEHVAQLCIVRHRLVEFVFKALVGDDRHIPPAQPRVGHDVGKRACIGEIPRILLVEDWPFPRPLYAEHIWKVHLREERHWLS